MLTKSVRAETECVIGKEQRVIRQGRGYTAKYMDVTKKVLTLKY